MEKNEVIKRLKGHMAYCKQDKCAKCNWNPTYFEEKKRRNREELKRCYEEMKKNGKKNITMS